MSAAVRSYPLWTLPIRLLWRLVTGVVKLTGLVFGLILSLVLMVVGLALISTLVGAIVGLPLFILGVMLLARVLY